MQSMRSFEVIGGHWGQSRTYYQQHTKPNSIFCTLKFEVKICWPPRPLRMLEAIQLQGIKIHAWGHLRSFEADKVIWGHWGHLKPLRSFEATEVNRGHWGHLSSLRSIEAIEVNWGHVGQLRPLRFIWSQWGQLRPQMLLEAIEVNWGQWGHLRPLRSYIEANLDIFGSYSVQCVRVIKC